MRGVGVLVLALSGVAQASVVETTTEEVKVGRAPKLVVQDDAGAIQVVAGAEGVVRVEAQRRAPSRDEALALKVTVAAEGDTVRVRYDRERRDGDRSVSFVIHAPAGTRLSLATSGGTVRAEGFRAEVEARTGGGAIATTRIVGAQRLESGGGSISADAADGAVDAQTGGGSIQVSGRLRGACRLSTGGGNVRAAIPGDSRLKIEASTGGGSARNAFGLPAGGRGRGRFAGTLGDGSDGSLELSSGGGNVELDRL